MTRSGARRESTEISSTSQRGCGRRGRATGRGRVRGGGQVEEEHEEQKAEFQEQRE